MASYNELLALIDAYINRNGVQAITGQILNGVLKAMVDQLGRGYTLMGYAEPTGDPGTPDGPESWFASVPGTYTNYGEIQVAAGELALLSFAPSEGWTKNTIYEGFREVTATADDNIGFPQVGVTYANGVLSFDFKNIKGEPGENGQDGDPAGFGAVTASVDDQVGTPSVSVSSSGPDTAKVFSFAFHNLKGETGVTSVVATVDNTSGNPQCSVSLQGGQLTLAFTGLKGAQGDTGSSVDYPFTIVNNLTTNDPAQALSAAMGVQLESEVSQLEAKVDGINITPQKTITTETTFEMIINQPLKANIPVTISVTGAIVVSDGLLNLDFYDLDGRQNRSTIYINGLPVTYTPTADITRIELLRVSTTGTGTVFVNIKQKSELQISLETIKSDIDEVNNELDGNTDEIDALESVVNGEETSTEISITWLDGYYTGAVLTPTGNGFSSGPIDVTAYRGKVIRVSRNVESETARYSYYVDNRGITQYLGSEGLYNTPDGNGMYYGDIPVSPDMSYLYVSMAPTATTRKVEVLGTAVGLVKKDKKVFVSTTGDDLNDGSELHPKKSILSALNSGNIIIVDEGIYNESIDLDGFDYNRVSIKALPGKKAVIKMDAPILLNNGFETLVSGYTKVYQTPLATNPFAGKTSARMYQEGGEGDVTTLISEMDRHPLQRGRQYRCDTDIIKQCASISAIETLAVNENKSGFFWDNGTMYFSRPRGTSGETPVVMPVFGNCFLRATKDKKIELENIEVRYGNIHIENCTDVSFKNVAILYANVTDTGGFYFKDCTGATLERCEAASITDGATAGDGFNFHTTSANGPKPHYLTAHLVDCWAHDNSDDGYSDHEYSEVTIDGGLYEFNGKGGITPSYGANDVIRNATSRYNISVERATGNGIYVTGDPTLERLKTCVIADGCVCYGNHFGLRSAQPECVLIARNCLVYGNDWGNYRANTGEGKLILIGCKSGNGSKTEAQNITTIEVN